MNNKLHLPAGRRRAAGTFHPCAIRNDHRARMRPVAAIGHAKLPLRAQWLRNAVTGALECHWIAEVSTEPHPRLKTLRGHGKTRMRRGAHSAALRPPSRLHAHG